LILSRKLDPSRLVDNASGWTDRRVGDVNDVHNIPGPRRRSRNPIALVVLGEFGGLGLPVPGHPGKPRRLGLSQLYQCEALTTAYLA